MGHLFRRLAEIQIENSSDPSLGRVEEVYLCDHCDQDFTSLTQLMVSFLFTLWDCGAFHKVFYCNFYLSNVVDDTCLDLKNSFNLKLTFVEGIRKIPLSLMHRE
jgi:hypothetical protein